jgi:hypothetical protein
MVVGVVFAAFTAIKSREAHTGLLLLPGDGAHSYLVKAGALHTAR